MLFAGIDPGENGALALLDEHSQPVATLRWRTSPFVVLQDCLITHRANLIHAYLEECRLFPALGPGRMVNTQKLLVNYGIWQGLLLAEGVPYRLVSPKEWQEKMQLKDWRAFYKKIKARGLQVDEVFTPLGKARLLWPQVSMARQADDGLAAALLLAECARQDHLDPLRRAIQQALEMPKPRRKKRRATA